jgi:enoyl-CoA hydratase/carnithine racemase
MLAKLTAKNQLTLPKAATAAVGASEYFEVETRDGRIILTPVRIQRADAVRAKLAELALSPADIDDAVAWARQRVAEPRTAYAAKSAPKKPAGKAAPRTRKRSGKA